MINKKTRSETNVFSIAAIDLFASTAGAFILMVIMLSQKVELAQSQTSTPTQTPKRSIASVKQGRVTSLTLRDLKIESNMKITLENVHFISGLAKFLPGAKEQLEVLAGVLQQKSDMRVEITGHVNGWDPVHRRRWPRYYEKELLDLSEDRAQRVKEELVKLGINERRIKIKGEGDKKMLYPQGDIEQVAYNRRVEVRFY